MHPTQPLFLYFFLFYIIPLTDKFLPILGCKLWISGVGSNRVTNCATTTAQRIGSFTNTQSPNKRVFPIKTHLKLE